MESLLVTGATGFVGRNLILRELRQGTRIFAPVRDAKKLRGQLESEGIDPNSVLPLPADPAAWLDCTPSHAVLSAGVLFARNREEYFRTNVEWTLQAIEALPEKCRITVLSSQSAGGPTPYGIASRCESVADSPVTWYGESKLELERAIIKNFRDRPITILRPPMILGPRDSATLPLFKMASGLLRTKPGLRKKHFSFLSVDDTVEAIRASWNAPTGRPFYISSEKNITDTELIASAAKAARAAGVTLPVPLAFVKAMSLVIDSVPALRRSAPSLTRDRAREIWPDRWVVDSSAFRSATGWKSTQNLDEALSAAHAHYVREGSLPAGKKNSPHLAPAQGD